MLNQNLLILIKISLKLYVLIKIYSGTSDPFWNFY